MQYFSEISSKNCIWKKNRVEWNVWGYTGSDLKKENPNPPVGAYGGRVTEGEGDGEGYGHSICFKDDDTSD